MKIYWFVNQFYKRGGTEIVTHQIIKFLNKDYDIRVILLDEDPINNELFKGCEELNISHFDIDKEIIRNEDFINNNLLRKIRVCFKLFAFSLFNKYKYRKKILKMTNEDDILIFNSPFGFMIAPKKRKVYFHVHYNDKYINAFSNQFIFNFLSIKPIKYILLTNQTLQSVNLRPAICIYNPARIPQKQNFEINDKLRIIFMARYEIDKNPLLALDVLKKLSLKSKNFIANFYGCGYLKEQMIKYLENNKDLQEFVFINNTFDDPKEVLDCEDVMIMTSKREGLPLSIIEAASRSVPTVLFNFGAGCDEIIKNNENGIIIDEINSEKMSNVLLKLINDQNFLKNLKIGAYKNSIRFAEDNIKDVWERFLNDAIK